LSLRILGETDSDDTDFDYGRYNKTRDWLQYAIALAPRDLPLYADVEKGLCEFMATLAGTGGANLLRLRSFKLEYIPEEFPDWTAKCIFHHPLPLLEELTISTGDYIHGAFFPIFVHRAPKLSRLSIAARYQIYDLVGAESINSLYLSLDWLDFTAFPTFGFFSSLRYLRIQTCVNEFAYEEEQFQDVLLPLLEDLTLFTTYGSNYIKAPKLETLRIFALYETYFESIDAPYFPSTRKFHWHCGLGSGDFTTLRTYLGKFPLLESVFLIHPDEARVKELAFCIRNDTDGPAVLGRIPNIRPPTHLRARRKF
jgi:hypothetical protein